MKNKENLSVPFKVVLRGDPRYPGKKIWYPKAKPSGRITHDELIPMLAKGKKEDEAAYEVFVAYFTLFIAGLLSSGNEVELENLGTFYPSLKTTGEDAPGKVGIHNIKRVDINFRASHRLKKRVDKAAGLSDSRMSDKI